MCCSSCAQQIASNAKRDGVPATLSVYPEKVHRWMILAKLPATVQAIDEINTRITERIAPVTSRSKRIHPQLTRYS